MRRYLKSRRAISGAVTALILVIVSVALALAVAVFAFGLFGTFGSSGQVQAIGTPVVNVKNAANQGYYNIILTVQIKNSGTVAASVQSVSIGDITVAAGNANLVVTPSSIPGGFDGTLNITITNQPNLPGVLQKGNIGGSVPVSITFSEGSLSPTLTLQGVLNGTTA
ncbi:MAG: hypothetical protein QXJ30_08370 [Metallosphaera sp.]|uniref:hypothetical protein n=1 Tax=Metallosphaera sp. TaxID=2020860 RepID=UPI00318241E5